MSPDGASQFHGNPLILDSLIMFGTDEGIRIGSIYTLDRFTGQLKWKSTNHWGVPSDAASSGDSIIYFVTRDDSLLALSVSDGQTLWGMATGWQPNYDHEPETNIGIPALVSSALVYDNTVLFVGRDSSIYGLNAANGKKLWEKSPGLIVTSMPLKFDDEFVVGLSDYSLVSIDPGNGTIRQRDTLAYLALDGMSTQDDRIVFLAGFENKLPVDVAVYDRSAGKISWVASLNDPDRDAYWYVPRTHIWRDWVVVGSTTGRVVAFDIKSGDNAWEYHLEGMIRGIGHSEDMLYVGTFSGKLYALNLNP